MPEISQEELELLERYKQLGTVDQVSGSLAGLQQMMHNQTINEAAKACGFKPQVLAKLSGGLDIAIKDNKPFVKAKDGTEVELSKYAEAEWGDFLPSLKAEPAAQTQQFMPFVPQPAKGVETKPTSVKLAKAYITRTYGQQSTVNN